MLKYCCKQKSPAALLSFKTVPVVYDHDNFSYYFSCVLDFAVFDAGCRHLIDRILNGSFNGVLPV
jgi:hypothetical protein